MSAAVASAVRQLEGRTLRLLWRQWGTLGAAISGPPAQSLIDPEALVLASLALREKERRLSDVLRWWATRGAPLLSVTRIRTLARRFPPSVRRRLGEFAHSALSEGHDFRWRPIVNSADVLDGRRNKPIGTRLRYTAPPALVLRLRLAFGVTVKADLLARLLGTTGAWVTVKDLAESIGYAPQSIRRAADDLVAARFIRGTGQTPIGYRIDLEPWSGLLGSSGKAPPPWHDWASVFGFVTALLAWIQEEAHSASASDYVLSSRARELVTGHQDAFAWNRVAIPCPEDYAGEAYLGAFQETLALMSRWLDENG